MGICAVAVLPQVVERMGSVAWPGAHLTGSFPFWVVVLRRGHAHSGWSLEGLSHDCWGYKGYSPTPNICRTQSRDTNDGPWSTAPCP